MTTPPIAYRTHVELSPEEDDAVRAALERYRGLTSRSRDDARADAWARASRPDDGARTEPAAVWRDARDRLRAGDREAGL